MANATAVLIYETEAPIRFNCASAAAFEKGDCVTLTGATENLVVAITSANADIFGGIVAEEKIADVGTSVALYRRGYFKVEAGTGGAVSYWSDGQLDITHSFFLYLFNFRKIGKRI